MGGCDSIVVEQVPYFPPTQTKADFPPEVCKGMLRAATGVFAMDLDVHSIRMWTMHAEVADCFKVGCLLLHISAHVGLALDAVHLVLLPDCQYVPGISGRQRLLGWGCRAPLSSGWRLWDEHGHPGCAQPGLEAGGRCHCSSICSTLTAPHLAHMYRPLHNGWKCVMNQQRLQ
jgi:hypothetical protein